MLRLFAPRLFVLALAFLILAEGHEASVVVDAFASQTLLAKLAWIIVVIVPLVLVPAAVWLGKPWCGNARRRMHLKCASTVPGRVSRRW